MALGPNILKLRKKKGKIDPFEEIKSENDIAYTMNKKVGVNVC